MLAAPLTVGLAPHGIAVLQFGGAESTPARIVVDRPFSPQQAEDAQSLAAVVDEALDESSAVSRSASIVLADAWVRYFMVRPAHNTRSLGDCQAAAAMRFQQLYGGDPQAWELRCDWDARQPFLACAVPRHLADTLGQVAARRRISLVSVAPQFIVAWNRWAHRLDGNAWFGVVHGGALTVAAIEAGRMSAVRTLALPQHAWQEPLWLPGQLAREALRLNLRTPETLQLCGDLPGDAWLDRHGHVADGAAMPMAVQVLDGEERTAQHVRSDALWLALTGTTPAQRVGLARSQGVPA